MEGAVIGYVPYVQPAKSSSIPDCFQENTFIRLPRSTNGPDRPEQDKMLNTSSADEQDSVLELTSNLNEDRRRLSLKSRNSAFAGKSELSERKGGPADATPALRLVVEETLSKYDQAVETNPAQNEEKSSRVPLKRSSSVMLESKSEQTSQTKKLCVETQNGPRASPVNEVGINESGSDNMDKISSKTELWAMNTSASSSVNMDNHDISSRSSPVDPEASESSGKKRYLFDFRPNTHQIIVKSKSGEKSFKCFVCGGIYQQKFSLKRHYLRNHIDFRYISENDISNCNIPIPYYIKKLHSNLDYKKTSNGRKKFKKSNNDIFLDNNDEHLMPGLYRCHDCPNITCNTETELKDHYNKHPEAIKKKYHCELCDASFFKKQILSRHLASHGKKKSRLECKKCGRDFPTQGELMLHSDSHVTGKTCRFCGKNLSTSANRKRHEAIHMGLKPHKCTLCGMKFPQSKDLDRHLRKHHSEFCRECTKCNKLFSTEEDLENHIKEKHSESTVKKQDPSTNNTEKESNAKLSVAASIPSAKPKSCTVCKRPFHTVYAMLKHKRQAHPYYSRKKRRVKQKVARSKEMSGNLEFRKTYAQPQKVYDGNSESPVRRGRPIQKPSTPKNTEKYVRRNGRPGPRSISKREEESFKEFYGNVAYEINKNILHHIDGRATQLSLKQYNFNDCPYSAEFFEGQGRLPWSHYNFPQWYDVDNALKMRGQEIKKPENLSSQDEFLYDATGLAPCNRVENPAVQAESNAEVQVAYPSEQITHLSLEEKKKLIGKEVIIVILCCVCKETFNSHEDYEQHNVNNHPNVEPNPLEFIGDKEKPPEVPAEFKVTYLSPVGHRFSCDVPPSVVEGCVKCTKCKSEFPSRGELYGHLTLCGNLKSYSSRRVWKRNSQRRIKNTMKNRMSTAEQHATLHAVDDDYMTPEKLEPKSSSSHSTGKGSKSTEKLQFYKSGRLQTTSVTVDMNYFNTKPMKPAKNGSKRGRKSYALVSSMYRNATMQATTSRECSDCRTTFPSVAALNQHHKIQHPESRAEDLGKAPVNYTPDPVLNASEENKITTQFQADSSQKVSRPRVNLFPPTPVISSAADDVIKRLSPFKAPNQKDLADFQPEDAPIDLSTNPCDKNESSLNKNVQQRSALQIAMDAVLQFSVDNDAEQKTKNEHISKLQETVEKLTVPSMSSVSKLNVVRKVGRPRKLKKDDSSPSLPLNFNSGLLGISSPSKSKPISKLEETVERLKASKVSSQDKNRENSVNKVSVTDKGNLVSQNEKRMEISSLKEPYQPILLDDKEKSVQATVNNSTGHKSASTNLKDSDNISDANTATDKATSEIRNQTVDKSASKGKTRDKDSSVISEKTSLNKNVAPVDNQQLPKVNFEEDSSQRLSALPSSEFAVAAQSPEKVSQSSHGRSSPTFDSILKVINQKLHSEEESSQHDDTAITWLEDEKFEIPPSRGNLNILMNASASVELTSTENKSSDSSVVDIPSRNDNLTPSMLPEKLDDTKTASESPSNKTVTKPRQPEDSSKKIASAPAENEVQTLPKDQIRLQKEMPKVPDTDTSGSDNISHETVSTADLVKTLKASKEIKTVSTNDVKKTVKASKEIKTVSTNDVEKTVKVPKEIKTLSTSDVEKIVKVPKEIKTVSTNDVEKTMKVPKEIKTVSTNDVEKTMKVPKEIKAVSTNDVEKTMKVPKEIKTVSTNNQEKTFKSPKEIKSSPECRAPPRRGPGRPRKKLIENVDAITQSIAGKESTPSSKPIEVDLVVRPVEKNIVSDNTSSLERDVSKDVCSPQSYQKKSDSPQDISKPSNETHSVKGSENEEQSSLLSNSDGPTNANQSEQPAVSLRTFRTKAKQSQSDSNAKSSFPLKNNITTEFGKSLASKMKEKMRLSFEQDSSKNATKIDEPASSLSRSTCEANTQLRDKLKAVKKECGDTVEPTKIHSCPYCMLEFAYLTNFRRHLKACLARTESKEADSTPGNSATNLQHLPKKDEVDYSMLNLYRHQSRQTQMLKEVEKNLGSDTPIKKYECTVCHRIYLNLFTFLQHKITQHNLAPQSSSEANASNDSPSCSSEMNDIGNTFATDVSTSDPSQQENELKLARRVNYESLIDSFISEQNNEFAVDDPPVCDFTETNCQVDSAPNEPECPTLDVQDTEVQNEDTDESQPPDLPVDSNDNESLKDEATPVKRRRGRPFGWRKNVNVPEANKSGAERKKVNQNLNKNGVLIYKRAGRPPSSTMSSSKLKNKTKKVPLNKVDTTRVKSEPMDSDTNSVEAEESQKSERTDPQNCPVKVKEETAVDASKTPSTNVSLSDDDFVDLKAKKLSKSSVKTKNASSAEVEIKNRTAKRGRGRSVTPVPGVSKTPTSTPEMFPTKRRPGRPPKNLQSAPGPSQPVKHIASGLPMRSGRKILPVTVESSDSECELVKPEIPVKKKINKVCPICKKKFLSTLALHRHTQIVHSRRTQPAVTSPAKSTDLPAKVSKKSPSKSPVANPTDGDTEVVAKKVEPGVKSHKICPICKNKFVSAIELRLHIQTFHSRKSEPIAKPVKSIAEPIKFKSPSPERPEPSGNQRPVSTKNKTIENFTRSSLTRQCRKSLPLLPKRVKKQSIDQMKKQKL